MNITRRELSKLSTGLFLAVIAPAQTQDPLPSWKDGRSKKAIIDFVQATTTKGSPQFVRLEERIATFDQDGTLWVEHPIYSQVVFALDRVVALAAQHPEWKRTEPFKAVLANDKAAIAKLTIKDLEEIVFATHAGMTVNAFQTIAEDWIAAASDHRFGRRYTELIYQPMLEVMSYLRASGYKTYIVTGGGQDFVRAYSDKIYGVPINQVIGSALDTHYTYNDKGQGILIRPPKLLLNNNFSGKPEDIYLFLGRAPRAAFGNSTGDQQMLEFAKSCTGASLAMLVHHDDAKREYAYGPAGGLPDTKIGTFSQALMDEAKKDGWIVISMKDDWKRIFAFQT
ncbi:MAG TPA: HAD family hydrolase [Bryobacteraceae bacterium]|nr:HAD family hydrolase [Bryobacteraceae bacterium]